MTAREAAQLDHDGGSARRLGTRWERRTLRFAWLVALASLLLFALIGAALRPAHLAPWTMLPVAAAGAVGMYALMSRRVHRRRQILSQPFPPDWEAVLQRDVVFFRALSPAEQTRFRRELQIFLGEKRITGIGTPLDTRSRVLAGASAIIPIFGFPEWEWDQISEILVYPSRFDEEFSFGREDKGKGKSILGMVGTGGLSRIMILSKPDLLQGFRNAGDKRNVGIHEFAHLVDKTDGAIDGLPAVGMDRRSVGPWVELVRRKMAEIERGDSDIDPYALTNEAEFFAVATEYFFERPGVMMKKHPDLYAALEGVFNQPFSRRLVALARARTSRAPRFGRNSPCPCGSGKKYKKCCLRRARS